MMSSVILPLVVQKYPRAQNRLPQYFLRSSGNSCCTLRDEQSWSCLVRQFGGEVKVDSYFTDHAASA
jgi:hypothetical protein